MFGLFQGMCGCAGDTKKQKDYERGILQVHPMTPGQLTVARLHGDTRPDMSRPRMKKLKSHRKHNNNMGSKQKQREQHNCTQAVETSTTMRRKETNQDVVFVNENHKSVHNGSRTHMSKMRVEQREDQTFTPTNMGDDTTDTPWLVLDMYKEESDIGDNTSNFSQENRERKMHEIRQLMRKDSNTQNIIATRKQSGNLPLENIHRRDQHPSSARDAIRQKSSRNGKNESKTREKSMRKQKFGRQSTQTYKRQREQTTESRQNTQHAQHREQSTLTSQQSGPLPLPIMDLKLQRKQSLKIPKLHSELNRLESFTTLSSVNNTNRFAQPKANQLHQQQQQSYARQNTVGSTNRKNIDSREELKEPSSAALPRGLLHQNSLPHSTRREKGGTTSRRTQNKFSRQQTEIFSQTKNML